jgi:hypothetical protein
MGKQREVERALEAAKAHHARATKIYADAKVKAAKSAMKLKATASAIKNLKREEANAKIPVSDDDQSGEEKLSAVEWAKRAGEEKLVAYRDHMTAAHAADAEAATSQALLDAQAHVEKLENEVDASMTRITALKKLVTESRFEADQVRSKGKYTTEGEVAKLKYEEIDKQNEEDVAHNEQELISEQKKLMLSQTALASLKGSGVLESAKTAQTNALAHLASSDAIASIASRAAFKISERADKATKLADMKAQKAEAARALQAKQRAEALQKLKNDMDTAGNEVGSLTKKLSLVKVASEKSDKAHIQAQLANEKSQKAKHMLHAMSDEGKAEIKQKKHHTQMKEVGQKAAGTGTPCDTCMSKCSTNVCRTWCNAQWCDGHRGAAHKKEIAHKLKLAKRSQRAAAGEVAASKASIAKDMNATKAEPTPAKELGEEKIVSLDEQLEEKYSLLAAAEQKKVDAIEQKIVYHGS